MKILRTIFLSALTATVVTLFWQQRNQPKPVPPPKPAERKSRTMEQMSATFKQFSENFDWDNPTLKTPEENAKLLKHTISEIPLQGLTELETVTIRKKLTELVNRMWIHTDALLNPSELPPSFENYEDE